MSILYRMKYLAEAKTLLEMIEKLGNGSEIHHAKSLLWSINTADIARKVTEKQKLVFIEYDEPNDLSRFRLCGHDVYIESIIEDLNDAGYYSSRPVVGSSRMHITGSPIQAARALLHCNRLCDSSLISITNSVMSNNILSISVTMDERLELILEADSKIPEKVAEYERKYT